MMPWPAYITGFFAILIKVATRLIDAASCLLLCSCAARVAALGKDGRVLVIGMAFLKILAVTSLGKSTSTGPGRPLVAISKASLIRFGRSATVLTITFHFVQALEIPITSASWNASLPIAVVGTCPQKTTIGLPSDKASCMGVTTLVA